MSNEQIKVKNFEKIAERLPEIADLIFIKWGLNGIEALELIATLCGLIYGEGDAGMREYIKNTALPGITQLLKIIDTRYSISSSGINKNDEK